LDPGTPAHLRNVDRFHVGPAPRFLHPDLGLRFTYGRHFVIDNLVTFFSLLNNYNQANIFTYYWDNEDREVDRLDRWAILLIGGGGLDF